MASTSQHWTQHLDELSRLINRARFGVISDFDGTLSPFVSDPLNAAMAPAAAVALDALLAQGVTLALVSGRTAADLQPRFSRAGVAYYGNHGLEVWDDAGFVRVIEEAQSWEPVLQALLNEVGTPPIPGVSIENKRVTASVHYRAAADRVSARAALHDLLAAPCERHRFILSEGLYIWEIKPPVMLNKGTAMESVIRQHDLDGVLFLGDDVTDFTAMSALRDLRRESSSLVGLSVGVVYPTSRPEMLDVCDLTTNGVDDTAALLHWIVQHLPSR